MGKGLGIAGMVVAILAIFTPVISLYIAWIGLLVATVASLAGDRVFSIVAVVVSAVNIFLLSPVALALFFMEGAGAKGATFLTTTVVLLLLPLVGMFLNKTGKLKI